MATRLRASLDLVQGPSTPPRSTCNKLRHNGGPIQAREDRLLSDSISGRPSLPPLQLEARHKDSTKEEALVRVLGPVLL